MARYDWTPQEIADMTPAQQLIALHADSGGKMHFDSVEDAFAYRAMRDAAKGKA